MDMEKVGLRPATPDDTEFAFDVKKAALGEYVRMIYGWDENEQRRLHAQRFDPDATRIIMDEGRDIGLLTVSETIDCIRILQIFLFPDVQGRGIGSHILAQVLAGADRTGRPVILRILKSNPRAQAFYERHGFTVIGETETHYDMERTTPTP